MKISKLAVQYEQNEDHVLNGRWLATPTGFKVKVAQANNRLYKAELARIQSEGDNLKVITGDDEEAADDRLTEVVTLAMASTILKDWDNSEVENEDEEPKKVQYDPKDGYAMMMKYPQFREDIVLLSQKQELYLAYAEKEISAKF